MPLIPNQQQKVSNNSRERKEITFVKSVPKYSLKDLIIDEKTLDEIETVIYAQKCWKTVFEVWGLGNVIKDARRLYVNLYGAPGTGKTMAAHAIASSLNKEMICVNYADIESKYVGETSKNLTSLFSNPEYANTVIFFDEADALLSRRVTNMSSATDVSVNQTRSVLLTLLNSYEGIVIFATNFISNYDSAFMRRIHYHIKLDLPNADLREQLWKKYIPAQMPIDADIHELAEKYDNLSGSDISTAVMTAALKAARKNNKAVSQECFVEALNSIKNSQLANSSNTTMTTHKSEIVPASEVPQEIREKLK